MRRSRKNSGSSKFRRIVRWIIVNRRTGGITVAQWPNPALSVFIVLSITRQFNIPKGTPQTALLLLSAVAILVWAPTSYSGSQSIPQDSRFGCSGGNDQQLCVIGAMTSTLGPLHIHLDQMCSPCERSHIVSMPRRSLALTVTADPIAFELHRRPQPPLSTVGFTLPPAAAPHASGRAGRWSSVSHGQR